MVISDTSISPDISFGNSESLKIANLLFSRELFTICHIIGDVISSNSSRTLLSGR